jgi:hypothetical protein
MTLVWEASPTGEDPYPMRLADLLSDLSWAALAGEKT